MGLGFPDGMRGRRIHSSQTDYVFRIPPSTPHRGGEHILRTNVSVAFNFSAVAICYSGGAMSGLLPLTDVSVGRCSGDWLFTVDRFQPIAVQHRSFQQFVFLHRRIQLKLSLIHI